MFVLNDDAGFCNGIWAVAEFRIPEFKIQNFKVRISNGGEGNFSALSIWLTVSCKVFNAAH